MFRLCSCIKIARARVIVWTVFVCALKVLHFLQFPVELFICHWFCLPVNRFSSLFTENFGHPASRRTGAVMKPASGEYQTILHSPPIRLIAVIVCVDQWFARFRHPLSLLGVVRARNENVADSIVCYVLFNRCPFSVIVHHREAAAHRLTLSAAVGLRLNHGDHPVARAMQRWPASLACLYLW